MNGRAGAVTPAVARRVPRSPARQARDHMTGGRAGGWEGTRVLTAGGWAGGAGRYFFNEIARTTLGMYNMQARQCNAMQCDAQRLLVALLATRPRHRALWLGCGWAVAGWLGRKGGGVVGCTRGRRQLHSSAHSISAAHAGTGHTRVRACTDARTCVQINELIVRNDEERHRPKVRARASPDRTVDSLSFVRERAHQCHAGRPRGLS